MVPAYYGDASTSFGILHPCTGTSRAHTLIICQPLFGETLCTHWVLKQVAQWASEAGYDVFRFDLSGTGNSLVDPASVSVPDWLEDVQRAADFMTERCGNDRVSMIGARLSFAFAAMFSMQSDIEELIGWDPLLDGSTWLTDRKSDSETLPDGTFEYQGYAVDKQAIADLAGLKVRSIDSVAASAVTTASHKWDCDPAKMGIDLFAADDNWDWAAPANAVFYAHNSLRLLCERLA